jgi:hypothetical protein
MSAVPEQSADVIEREVWASAADFVRVLSLAAPRGIVPLDHRRFRVPGDNTELTVELEPGGERALGELRTHVLHVRYRLEPGNNAAGRDLLAAIERAMQRGGG